MAEKILVYGGTGGMGAAIARALHARGYELHLVARDEEALTAMEDDLGASFTAGDVLDESLFSRVTEAAGPTLAGLVYAVGTINVGSFRRLDADDYLRDFQINAVGAALAVRAALPALKKSEAVASVVFFSSIAARQGFPLHASVGMSKGAVLGLTLSLAAELAPDVRVNAIAPSLTRTPLAKRFFSNEKRVKALANMHPLQRLGTPEDMAALTAFLISPDAAWITGQVIGVDGGRATLQAQG
jgi:NAD(P)-dependent dehydrogenase (short-subunit alcohol dehydrogenase family)